MVAISDVAVANGVHRVTFKIADRAGNEATVVRLVNVNSGVEASTVIVEPEDAALDKLFGGSVYWMNVKATDIERYRAIVKALNLRK